MIETQEVPEFGWRVCLTVHQVFMQKLPVPAKKHTEFSFTLRFFFLIPSA